jgi:carbonic anhydrase
MENPLIQTVWNNLPLEKNEYVTPPGVGIDLTQLLPGDRSYYTYMGSLTTPPCTEGVLWLVLKQAQQISSEQLAIFARLYRHNARPVQANFARMIKESR